MTFLCETTTPAGSRVDPDVYCRYAGLLRLRGPVRSRSAESRSSESISTTQRRGVAALRATRTG